MLTIYEGGWSDSSWNYDIDLIPDPWLVKAISTGDLSSRLTTWWLKRKSLYHEKKHCFPGMSPRLKYRPGWTCRSGMLTTSLQMIFLVGQGYVHYSHCHVFFVKVMFITAIVTCFLSRSCSLQPLSCVFCQGHVHYSHCHVFFVKAMFITAIVMCFLSRLCSLQPLSCVFCHGHVHYSHCHVFFVFNLMLKF